MTKNKKSTARQHHYVPQCYLKRFTCPDRKPPQIFVVDRSGNSFYANPKNIACERDFNRIDLDGHDPDLLENSFSRFETVLSSALDELILSEKFDDKDVRQTIFEFIDILVIKNPKMREKIDNFTSDISKQLLNLVLASPERYESEMKKTREHALKECRELPIVPYEQMKALHEKGDAFEITAHRHFHLKLEEQSPVLETLYNRRWTLLKAPPNEVFITSDHPVRLIDLSATKSVFGIGHAMTETEVFFPISPTLALSGQYDGVESKLNANVFDVAIYNARTIASAKRQVFSSTEAFSYVWTRPRSLFMSGCDLATDPHFCMPR